MEPGEAVVASQDQARKLAPDTAEITAVFRRRLNREQAAMIASAAADGDE